MSEKIFEKKSNPQQDSEENTYDSSKVGDAALLELLNEEPEEEEKEEAKEKNENVCKKEGEKEEESKESTSSDSTDSTGLSDSSDPKALAGKLLNLALAILKGETPADDLLDLLDAAKASEAIEAARREGEIAGRNATIEEHLRPVEALIPTIKGSAPARPHQGSIFDIAAAARS